MPDRKTPTPHQEATESVKTNDLLKQCLNYCSHAWPSDKIHETLLSSVSCSTRPEPDPADLSTLLFSDASDEDCSHQGSQDTPDAAIQGRSKFHQAHLQASAINPALTSKHAKIAQMQRMLHRDMEKKERTQEVDQVNTQLSDPGMATALPCTDIDPEETECRTPSHELPSNEALDSWSTSITRKHQREVSMKELKMQEWRYLRSNFGKVMKDLESQARTTSQTSQSTDDKGVGETASDEQVQPDELEEDFMDVASIRHLNHSECRRLLQQMKPLVHAPAALYRALAKRALDEYVKFNPQSFSDCRRITFWQFGNDKARHQRDRTDRYAGQPFFNFLTDLDDKDSLLGRLMEMHRISAVYMLQTLLESRNVVSFVFQEVGRYVAERISDLDGDSIGRLVYVFAKAGVKNPGLFNVVKQEGLRRCRLKEGHHSLCPKAISDMLVAFATAKIVDDELFEVLMVRAVSLMDTDLKPELPSELCGAAKSCAGEVPATPFLLQDLVQVARSLSDLQRVDHEFFDDMSTYIVNAAGSHNEKMVDWFVGNPASLSNIASVFIKARFFRADVFSTLKSLAARRKEDMRSESLQQLRQALAAQKGEEEKQERKKWQPPERRRGCMGRGVIEQQPPKFVQTRREKAREQRQRLAAMSEEEVAREIEESEKHAGLSASAKVLLSNGYKVEAILEAQEGSKDGKRTKTEIMEASTAIRVRSMVKGKKARHEESSASAKAELRRHSRSKR